ncbi:glycosyltransferase family 4 protein [Clostridium sp. YIM B02505]|uniref:Glycosyltransferase family 4 protein n=1 Tax=Clostridium yunnanense TaxID=2800325 RepID=A0ABS1EVI5_9CLOT|nr:glycosyltransferase family 4 protein [Clostridium yunnanense]MBK1813402.1 glycosyltransferase family 4 protein [Clostridium yunnanense]
MDNNLKNLKQTIESHIKKNNIDIAYALAEDYVKLSPTDPDGYYLYGYLLMLKDQDQNATLIFNNGLAIDEKNGLLNFSLGNLLNKQHKSAEALKYFCKSKLFNPSIDFKISVKNDFSTLNIVLGSMEIANQMHTSVKGLRKLGHNAKSINYYPSYLGYTNDYTLDLSLIEDFDIADLKTKRIASELISENNVFHLFFGTSLTLDHSDLPLLKELGKKVVMQYWGSDVRMYSRAVKLNKYVKVKNMDEEQIKRHLEFISYYVSDCLVDYELAEYVKDFHTNIHYIRPAIDLSEYNLVEQTKNDKPLIVHAPTSPEFKGTPYILSAVEELKQYYDFDFKLVHGVSHEQAIKIYAKADLIIDQILTGSYGLFCIEAMAMGKPVICYISDFMKEKYPKDLPIISANPDNIKETIRNFLTNKDIAKDLRLKGRSYVEKYHDMNLICSDLYNIYNKL